MEYLGFHRRIRQNSGVTGFVQFGDRLALLPDQLISEIRIRTGANELIELNHRLEQGQNVRIIKGPFQGSEALVTGLIAARERVEILLEWMGRSLHAEASIADVLAVTDLRA